MAPRGAARHRAARAAGTECDALRCRRRIRGHGDPLLHQSLERVLVVLAIVRLRELVVDRQRDVLHLEQIEDIRDVDRQLIDCDLNHIRPVPQRNDDHVVVSKCVHGERTA